MSNSIEGDYKIIKKFSSGAMGDVYLVEKYDYDYPFVLKKCKAVKPQLKKTFINEVKNWVSFGVHPNIVKCIFAEEIGDELYVAAEYVEGYDNKNMLSNYVGDSIQNYLLVKWTIQFCYAIKHCISKGMIAHSDIKPDNILVDNDLNLKLSDFGLSKSYSDDVKNAGGTPLYYSPEHIKNPKNVDYRSDIYSFGIVLYQLITKGQFPFSYNSYDDLIEAHLFTPPKAISHPFYPIVKKCLAKDLTQRYSNVDELKSNAIRFANENKIKVPQEIKCISDEIEEHYIMSKSLSAIGRNEEALGAIIKYLTMQSNYSVAWTQKGKLELELGKRDEAKKSLKKSIQLYPYSTAAYNNLGVIYWKELKLEKAIKALTNATILNSKNSGAFMNLGNVYQISGFVERNIDKAIDSYIKALRLAPNKSSLHNNIGVALKRILSQGKYVESKPLLKELIKLNPMDKNSIFNLGVAYYLEKKYPKAIKCFKNILEDTNDVSTIQYLIKCFIELNKDSKAIDLCNRLIRERLEPILGIILKAKITAKTNYQEGINLIQGHASRNPNQYALWEACGDIQASASNYEEAIISQKRAIDELKRKPDYSTNSSLQKVIIELKNKISKYLEQTNKKN